MPGTKTIQDIQRELAAKERQLSKLRTEREKLAAGLQAIDRQISALEGGPTSKRGPVRSPRQRRAKKLVRRVRPAARKAARAAGKPLTGYLTDIVHKATKGMRAPDLAAAVLKAGYVTKDKNFKQTVAGTLSKDKRFKRVSRGVYRAAGR